MAKKINPELLKEELKKFKLLSEYDFYQEKKEAPKYKNLDEEDAPDDAVDVDDAAKAVGDDLGVNGSDDNTDDADNANTGDDTETTGDIPEPDATDDTTGDETAADAVPTDDTMGADDQTDSDAEEIDVTSLVKGSEDAKLSADHAAHNSEMLMQKLANLEAQVASMGAIGSKIEDLEKEIIKRNPTPVEKLEMRSLDSYPYSQKLTDYWADKKGAYDVMDNGQPKKEEYVLTKDDVDNGYSDANIKKSFGVKKDYEEEDVNKYDEEDI
jgi:hypothetical protein